MIRLPNRKIHNRLNLLSIKTIYLHFRKYTVSTRKYHLPLRANGLHKINREKVIPTKIREGGNNSISVWVSKFKQTQQFQLSTKKPIKKEFFFLHAKKKLINQRGKIAHSDTVLSFLFSLFYRTPKPSKGFSKQHYWAILFYTLQTALSSFILFFCSNTFRNSQHGVSV